MKLKVDKKKLILTKVKLLRERGAVYSEIAKILNDEGIKTMSGAEWETRNLFNYYNRNKKSAV